MDVLMPQLGETVAEGKISKWFVKAGDAVKPGDNLFEIETDKVSMDVPAIAAGTLAAIHVQAGEVAPVGAVVAIIQGKGETIAPVQPQAPLTPAKAGVHEISKLDSRLRENERGVAAAPERKPHVSMQPFREVRSPERNFGPARLPGGSVTTPLARRLAGEAGIDLANVKGSGPRGRIVARDIEEARKVPALAPIAARPFAHVVITADIAVTQSLALCVKTKLSLADVIVKAWALALARASLDASGIALTTGTRRAMIRDAAGQSLTAIAAARSAAATDVSASAAIFIADVPGIVSVADVPQPAQTALLSLGSPRRAPVEAADGSVTFVDTVTATLACDARAFDAARGAELLGAFKRLVEQPVMMIV